MKKNVSQYDEQKRRANGLNAFAYVAMPLLKKILGKRGTVVADLMTFWDKIVGEESARFTMPEKISFKKGERADGILYVAVANGAFALEFQHREKFIINKVNEFFGYSAVSGIKIRQSAGYVRTPIMKFNPIKRKKILVTEEEQNYIDELTEDVKNKTLKESLARLGKNVLADNRK